MAPKEPTRAQLSSKLRYQAHKPAFLLKLENKIAGIADAEEDEDEEFEHVGGGREPIPRRPAIPERPAEDPGSSDEDYGDEKPQIVVLKQGKHLTEQEAENVRRKEKGLLPVPDPDLNSIIQPPVEEKATAKSSAPQFQGLSFSSSKPKTNPKLGKRKAVGQPEADKSEANTKSKKKKSKPSKALLSFGDDA